MTKCPFKSGDLVVYKPTSRGLGLSVMTDFRALQPGNRYKVVDVVKDVYLVLEGFENSPGGGLHWSEFAPDD